MTEYGPIFPGSEACAGPEARPLPSVAPVISASCKSSEFTSAQLTDPPTAATLIDHHGRTWNDMSFVRFEPLEPSGAQGTGAGGAGGRTDRGRVRSLAYRATFVKFL